MWKKVIRVFYWILPVLLVLLSLMACKPDDKGMPSKPFPTVHDPDIEINVTPGTTSETGHFTITVERMGTQSPGIAWFASGEVYVSVPIEISDNPSSDDTFLLHGVGFGKAGYNVSKVCVGLGGWPIEFIATGQFDVEKCELNLMIEESWPYTDNYAACFGHSASATGQPYKLNFPNLKFTEEVTRLDTTMLDQGVTEWDNTFKLYPKEGLEDTGCDFSPPEEQTN